MPAETILIVEDDTLLNWSMQEDLNQHGYKMLSAETGEEALEKIEKKFYSIALIDIMLPDFFITVAF